MTKNKAQKAVAGQPAASTSQTENYSTFNLCKLIKILNRKKLFALKWLQKVGMLNRETTCDNCGRPMTLVHRQACTGTRADTYEWECSKCRMCSKSLRNGTVFQSSKLSLQKITILMYFWAHDFPPHVAQRELSINERTVNKWYLLCQEACMDALIRNTSKLGGEGRNLEVVEGKLGKRAMDTYRTPAEHPAIGVIDVDTGSCFLQVVIGNTKTTLLTLLKERIANGTTLHSKCWRIRDCLNDEKFCKVVKNHKLTLSNEDRKTFQKLHSKTCQGGDKMDTSVSFDPVLCAAIYKNAMKREEFFFVKFLGELGTLYRDGIRYEMMNQLEHSEPGPSKQQRPTANTSEKTEWTSAVGTPCHKCRSKKYNNSEVQATESKEVTICVDVDEPRNVSVSKQNARKSNNLSEGYSGTSDDIIVLDDTCKAQNGVTSERTVLLEDVRHEQSSAGDTMSEAEQSVKCAYNRRSGSAVSTSCHISETDCAEVNEVVTLEKCDELANGSAGEKDTRASRNSTEDDKCEARGAVSPARDSNPQSDDQLEIVLFVSECDNVVDIGGDEPKEVCTEVYFEEQKQTEEGTSVGHFDEIEISNEEQIAVDGRVDERETIEIGAEEGSVQTCEQQDVRRDVDVTGGGDLDPEMAAHGNQETETDNVMYEERDEADTTTDNEPRAVYRTVNNTTVETEENGLSMKMVMLTEVCKEVASDVNAGDVGDIPNERTVDDKNTNGSPGGKRNESSDVVNINEGVDTTIECTAEEGKTNAKPDGKGEAGSGATESTVKDSKTSASPGTKRSAGESIVNVEDSIAGGSKTSATDARKREATSELVNIDKAEGDADERMAKRSKTGETASINEDVVCDLVDIDNTESTVKHGRATVGKKRDSSSDLVNTGVVDDSTNECPIKRCKMSPKTESERKTDSGVVSIDNNENNANAKECVLGKRNATPKRKCDAASDIVNVDDNENNANVKEDVLGRRNATPKRKSDAASDIVNIDDNENNANEKEEVLGKRNAAPKRKSDVAADIVNVDDSEDSSNERKDVLSKINRTARKKSGVVADVVNIDDVEDNTGEQKVHRGSANRTGQKESSAVSDVIDIDEVDSDVEVIETVVTPVPDVVVLDEQRQKVYQNDNSQQHERRLLIDNVPCILQKSVLKAYFSNFGRIDYIKILPIPSRRSSRYAMLVFKTKQVVDTIQATRPHVLESGVKLVTFRGSSPDIDSSLNTRLKRRMIVKVPKHNTNLTTEDVQQYFSEYGQIFDIERVILTGMESGSSTFVVGFEDYDSADVACMNSPHTIKGVENVVCEKVEDDDLLLSGTKMDPICIENDSDVEEVKVDAMKTEPSTPSQQSQEGNRPNEQQTASGGQSGGAKRPADETPVVKRKKFRRRKNLESNNRTPQNTTAGGPTPIPNGRIAVPGGSGQGVQSGAPSWHTHGRQAPQRPAQAATPAPPAGGGVRTVPADVHSHMANAVAAQAAMAVRQISNLLKQAADVRTYVPQAQPQAPPPPPPPPQPQAQTPRPPFQVPPPQWRRPPPPPPPAHFQPRWAYSWTPAKREPPTPARPTVPHRVLTGVPITSTGFSGPSHVTRTRPPPPTPGSSNTPNFTPRATGSQGPRF